jgi:hypothetical protein
MASEIQKMPVYLDILENKVLGPPYKKGLEEGWQEGLREGKRKGELAILRRLIEKRVSAPSQLGRSSASLLAPRSNWKTSACAHSTLRASKPFCANAL